MPCSQSLFQGLGLFLLIQALSEAFHEAIHFLHYLLHLLLLLTCLLGKTCACKSSQNSEKASIIKRFIVI